MKQVYTDGSPVPEGACVVPDHNVMTFTVTIRSTQNIGPQRLKDLIQQSHEVTEIEQTDHLMVCQTFDKSMADLERDRVRK